MKIIAITQARMGSTRLPGKVMQPLAGEPMLVRHVNRVQRARTIKQVVVATTTREPDRAIADLCADRGWACFRGSEDDVLDRYYGAAVQYSADVVVRITSDCPLIEPEIIDKVVSAFLEQQPIDYVCNRQPRHTYPRGLDTEVMSFAALERAWREDKNSAWREHVALYIVRHPELFKLDSVASERDLSYMRWTVDTPEDLAFARLIYDHFGNDTFSWLEVVALLKQHPEWLAVNEQVRQKEVPW